MPNTYLTPVIDTAFNDFPFMESLPKREKSKLAKMWDSFKELAEIQKEHGYPVPRTAAAILLEITPQRIDQLVESGKLIAVKFHGHVYVTENSLLELARSDRKSGRPLKVLESCSTLNGAYKVAQQMQKK